MATTRRPHGFRGGVREGKMGSMLVVLRVYLVQATVPGVAGSHGVVALCEENSPMSYTFPYHTVYSCRR